jgi:hypothetical protein
MTLHKSENGSMVLSAILIAAVLTILVGSAIQFTSHNSRIGVRQREIDESVAAAEGVLEYSYAVWKQIIREKGLRAPGTSELSNDTRLIKVGTTNNVPATWLTGTGNTFFNFSLVGTDQWGTPASSGDDDDDDSDTPPMIAVAVPDFPGWRGDAYFYRAQVEAEGQKTLGNKTKLREGLRRHFQMTQVPLFQTMAFFEGDLEIHPGAEMILGGLLHTNKDLYAAGYAPLQFKGNVSYVGNYTEGANSGDWSGSGGGSTPKLAPYWADGKQGSQSTTRSSQIRQNDRMEPFGTEPWRILNTADTNQNNDSFHELIEPPVSGAAHPDPVEISQRRLFNKASLRITIDSSKAAIDPTRITIRDGSNNILSSALRTTEIKNAISATTTIYDWREGTNVKVTSIDVKTLNTALTNLGSSFNGVMYVQDVNPTGKNAVRLKNGEVLVRDLTVASQNAVYVEGDFNTGTTGSTHNPTVVPSNYQGNPDGTDSPVVSGYTKRAAAVIGDAVMILSNNWDDANSAKTLMNRVATPTTVNAAILSGHVPTNGDDASGGLHNFPRFLELWYDVDFTYWGSMVQVYNSKTFNSPWQTGNVYYWPNRKWTYEPLFTKTPPPGAVNGMTYSRGRWERF